MFSPFVTSYAPVKLAGTLKPLCWAALSQGSQWSSCCWSLWTLRVDRAPCPMCSSCSCEAEDGASAGHLWDVQVEVWEVLTLADWELRTEVGLLGNPWNVSCKEKGHKEGNPEEHQPSGHQHRSVPGESWEGECGVKYVFDTLGFSDTLSFSAQILIALPMNGSWARWLPSKGGNVAPVLLSDF